MSRHYIWRWLPWNLYYKTHQISNLKCLSSRPADALLLLLYWSHVLSWEWRCSWSSADRRCSNYIWVINNLIAHQGATYIRDLTVLHFHHINFWKNVILLPQYPYIDMPSSDALSIDLSHKSHNTLDKYHTMHHFVTEMCTHVHISVTNGALWDMGLVHCGYWLRHPVIFQFQHCKGYWNHEIIMRGTFIMSTEGL